MKIALPAIEPIEYVGEGYWELSIGYDAPWNNWAFRIPTWLPERKWFWNFINWYRQVNITTVNQVLHRAWQRGKNKALERQGDISSSGSK